MRIRTVKPAFIDQLDKVLETMQRRRGPELFEIEKEVSADLLAHPELSEIVKDRVEYFIRWAAYYRLSFKADIIDEVKSFTEDNLHLIDSYTRPSSTVWQTLKQSVFQRDQHTCSYCGERKLKLECDHIIPISKGGGNTLSNLTTACKPCNRSKSNKTVEQFLKWRAGR